MDIDKIYTLMGILTALGGAVIWLLSQRFASKATIARLYKRIEEEREEVDAAIEMVSEAQRACEQKHLLAEAPAKQLADSIKRMEELVSKFIEKQEERDRKNSDRILALEIRGGLSPDRRVVNAG